MNRCREIILIISPPFIFIFLLLISVFTCVNTKTSIELHYGARRTSSLFDIVTARQSYMLISSMRILAGASQLPGKNFSGGGLGAVGSGGGGVGTSKKFIDGIQRPNDRIHGFPTVAIYKGNRVALKPFKQLALQKTTQLQAEVKQVLMFDPSRIVHPNQTFTAGQYLDSLQSEPFTFSDLTCILENTIQPIP
ncbi:unnamed protein product [Protopolystoma xenopodis]|uniref:Uncharacterized protein n=1 Tax=Protopolystoma xenopodis TaxID=117903 RepID=A0A448WLH5_9PLAT|nr:unnamed protein product [Protopolystoma xenopodis]